MHHVEPVEKPPIKTLFSLLPYLQPQKKQLKSIKVVNKDSKKKYGIVLASNCSGILPQQQKKKERKKRGEKKGNSRSSSFGIATIALAKRKKRQMYSIARRFQEEPEKAEKRPASTPQPQGGTKEMVLWCIHIKR
jgi:hypothetical protein